uniref:caspase-2-like n=1 Tax=Styela clava TaxID=7725 RepID=UPI0019396C6D|nr:caspase-2-like [Styela clava]
MKKLWKDTLKCELLEVHCDKTAEEMRTLLRQVGEEKDCDYAVVVISTHGGMVAVEEHTSVKTDKQDQNETPKSEESVNTEKKNKSNPKKYEEVLFGNDRSKLKAEEIQEIFRNENTKNLQDKPKLFILQYCRGSILDCGVDRDDFSDYPDTGVFYHIENQEYLGQDLQETTKVDTLMPSMCDVVTAYPTHLNHQAFNSKSSGSWIIRYISEVFGKYYKTKHVTDMLTIVNNKMKNHRGVNEHGKNCKAMSIYESSLTKDFYLV